MTMAHERYVASRFTEIESRFRDEVAACDYRLLACIDALNRITSDTRILDLGCGKGRFARHFRDLGADVIGLDGSQGMLARANGLDRVRGSALRLPFASESFDSVLAIEVFEHIPSAGISRTLAEANRVLKPGGRLVIVDKNLYSLDTNRPWLPKVVVKKRDECKGLWMYPNEAPVREKWLSPSRFTSLLSRTFTDVKTRFLMSPEESCKAVFRWIPQSRLMTLWTASARGAP
jgi:SAM-dependent methyltransferase